MSIPFTQYLRPDGRKKQVVIDMPQDIEQLAELFLLAGGRYECEVLTTGQVSLTAVKDDQDVEIVICQNGPEVPGKVDALVRLSLKHLI